MKKPVKKTKVPTKKKAFDQGWVAFGSKIVLNHNPYDHKTERDLHLGWYTGWTSAYAKEMSS